MLKQCPHVPSIDRSIPLTASLRVGGDPTAHGWHLAYGIRFEQDITSKTGAGGAIAQPVAPSFRERDHPGHKFYAASVVQGCCAVLRGLSNCND